MMDIKGLFLLFLTVAAESTLPFGVVPCPRDPELLSKCALKQAPGVLSKIMNGDKSLKIPPIDPFTLSSLALETGSLKVNLTNIRLEGIRNAVIRDIEIDEKNHISRLRFTVEKLIGECDARAVVNMPVLKVDGRGHLRLEIYDVEGTWSASLQTQRHSDGLEYLDLDKGATKLKIGKVTSKLDKFNGNVGAADVINTILNQNADIILEEVQPALEMAADNLISVPAQVITKKYSTDKMFA